MTEERFLTPPQVAKILGVGPDKVAAFIARGELIAVNASLSTRPRWKVAPESLRKFLDSRSNAPKPKKRAAKSVPAATKAYF